MDEGGAGIQEAERKVGKPYAGRRQSTIAIFLCHLNLLAVSLAVCHFTVRCNFSACVVLVLFSSNVLLSVLWNMERSRIWLLPLQRVKTQDEEF